MTAADEGKKPESTTYRLSWSHALHSGSSGDVAGSLPKRTVPHWCENDLGLEQAREDERVTGGAKDFLALGDPSEVGFQIRAVPVQVDRAVRADRDAAVRMRQILALRVPVDAAQGERGTDRLRHEGQRLAQHRFADLAERLQAAQRCTARAFAEVVVSTAIVFGKCVVFVLNGCTAINALVLCVM